MTTWGSLRADLRLELKDPNATKWPDGLMYIYIKDALNDYSQYFPIRKYAVEIVIEEGETGYTLPEDFLKDVLVESPATTYLKRYQKTPGTQLLTRTTPRFYYIEGNKLFLNAPTDGQVFLTYDALHPTPAALDDDTFVLTVPLRDEELIRLYIKAAAHGHIRGKSARLDRFKPVGTRDDNPLIPEVELTYQDYMAKIAERLGGKTHFLHRKR